MRDKFRGRDYLGLKDFTKEEMNELIELTQDLKRKWVMGEPHAYLRDRSFGMIFEKKSTRTRNSFHAAATALGAQSFYLRPDELQTSRGEPIKDTARIIDRYFDGLYIRTFGHEIVEEFAQYMKNPVINALTALEHPCQGLTDLVTIKEKKGDFKGLKVCYAGDVYNVCHSLMIGSAMFGMDIYVAAPKGYDPDPEILRVANEHAAVSGSKVIVTQDFDAALKDADVVYGNTWHSMGENEEQKEQRIKDFMPYQINKQAMEKARKDAIFMHCLPGYRGEDMTDEVIEGSQSAVWDQGENRMHTVKAVLVATTIK
ncbi:ornithine carbamoyltransferase [Enterococcus sp. PF1-24]|uniref:ornithine carbamoyltransferase n=1 Tax=unclassified Enterococcus TaxID=2608891 RepID=UPI0024766F6B|nr:MULTISPECIES: ornithine carbamoyltransferase [unclassified Enterococcus]MDH6365351.1 ornithine carbamoyltransferase [Enterococcus sp. PFB1-1]MDH6402452.1 ornithine carbamoyltransferase [Enterococcus sp. PF1-24]